jgi:hypothetical protein
MDGLLVAIVDARRRSWTRITRKGRPAGAFHVIGLIAAKIKEKRGRHHTLISCHNQWNGD